MSSTTQDEPPVRKTKGPIRIMRVTVAIAALAMYTYVVLFQFDFRCLSGFDLLVEIPQGATYMATDSSWIDEKVSKIYVSKSNSVLSVLDKGSPDDLRTAGPTVFVTESGRFRITHGAYIDFNREGCVIYAQ